MTGFLVIGESVADIVRTPGRPDTTHPGGSPANVALGLARLGRGTALLTQLGADQAGDRIARHLRSAGVRLLTDGQVGVRTPTAVVTLDRDGGAGYAFDLRWTLRPVEPEFTPGHVHFGSVAAVREPGCAAVLDLVERLRGHATISYDPNVRPQLMGGRARAVARVEACAAAADVVKASDQDLAWLHPGEPHHEVAARWLALGPAVVLVTRGGAGAAAFTRDGSTDVPAPGTEVVDTVGAGDSFMAATLDALASLDLLGAPARRALAALDRDRLLQVLHTAAAAAAITVSRAGAALPTAAELHARTHPGGRG
jgi:fructokinase